MARKAKQAVPRSAADIFKAIDKSLRAPGSGCGNALQYMEQSSWLLFLRYLDAMEPERRVDADSRRVSYAPVLKKSLSWSAWAFPRKADGSFDIDHARTGDDLIKFVNETLFPNLRRLRNDPDSTPLQRRIGDIFAQLRSTFTDGYKLHEVISLIDPLNFETEESRHELSALYEERLKAMGNAGRDGGQYYTPRPLIKVMVRIIDPKVGETIYDGACGSGGFLCEAYDYMHARSLKDPKAYRILQEETFSGGEYQTLPFLTAQMNCILHGLAAPDIRFGDTLAQKIADFTAKDRVDVILVNPPFGAATNAADVENFTVTTSESAYLFLEHFIEKLKRGGRAAVIIKNTFLSNDEAAANALRRMLLTKCRLHWVLDLPQKVFAAGVRTVVLFFSKDGPTVEPINYYQLDLGGVSLGKTRPILESDLTEFESFATGKEKPHGKWTWTVDPAKVDQKTFDLSVVNPHIKPEKLPSAAEVLASLRSLHADISKALEAFK